MASWPSWMPCALQKQYSYQRKDIVARTEMETGRTRMRQRFADGPVVAQISWVMTRSEFAYFEGWFLHTINAGALPFTMPIKVGSGTTEHECRFVGTYGVSLPSGRMFTVTATLEIEQIQVYDAETLGIIDLYGDPDAYGEFLDLFEIFVNQSLPASEMGA